MKTFIISIEQLQSSKMKREKSSQSKMKKVVELFSDLMLMKFRPKNGEILQASKPLAVTHSRRPSQDQTTQANVRPRGPAQISFLELASNEAVVIGNASQLDMINLDGLSHNFVDTFYYWSLNISRRIDNVKLSIKKELMLILSGRTLLLYSYNAARKEKSEPLFISSMELKNDVKFMQFPASDLIGLFYQNYFEIYSLNDSNKMNKRLEKTYGVAKGMKLFAVPQAIDHAVNIFFEEAHASNRTFGLWCVEVQLLNQSTKISQPYKIYDIMCSLKRILILQNYSKDIIFLNLGQEILVASKGYIVDSVNINLQGDSSYLRYLPRKQVLVHIQRSSMDLYSFTIDESSVPHRIKLAPIDSIQISCRQTSHLLKLLPVLHHNYALFYEEEPSRPTTRGQLFYSFVLSYTVELPQKVQRIFSGRSPSDLGQTELQMKCEVLRKIGLSEQQIFLEVWRRSGRSTLRDYQFLLAIRDYKTIKNEIQEKLRKQSMGFKEVLKIQESCLLTMKPIVDSEQCNQELLKDYLTCSLFLRKLALWKQLHLLNLEKEKKQGGQQRSLYINIQDYFHLKNIQLKQFVTQRVQQYLFNGRDTIAQIRLILHHFRFLYRYIYRELLEQIILISKNELKRLLEVLPELLPTGKEFLWGEISQEEWENGMYLQRVVNVANREAIDTLIQGLWFKRNWLTMHDLIDRSRAEIQQANLKCNSVDIFYFYIGKVFENIRETTILYDLLSFTEANYSQLPNHLRGKILLYSKLHNYYTNNHNITHCPPFSFAQFLQLRDPEIFRYFFDFERTKKNTLLKEIKPIYESVLGKSGEAAFNQSLFNYFRSQTSEISNLKYLLNRINNEKKEFHTMHQPMYEMIIRALQFKLHIGGPADVPIEEVLLYVQNIPVSSNNKAMLDELSAIQRISSERQTFRRMRINMSIREILDNHETVIEKLVDYSMKVHGILNSETLAAALQRTYRILAEVQSVKEKVYGMENNELALFIFLTKVMQHEGKIATAKDIITDQYLNNYYFVDHKIVESLVLYMYRWKFSKDLSFVNNRTYILKLCELLQPGNPLRQYIENQLEFAIILSTPKQPALYPISSQGAFPRIIDLEDILQGIDNYHINKIDINRIIELMLGMEGLSRGLSQLHKTSLQVKQSLYSEKIQESAVRKAFIANFITRGLIKEAVPLVKQCIIATEKPEAVTTLILLYNLLPQLNEESRNSLVRLSAFLYSDPLKLLGIMEHILAGKLTGLQCIDYLHSQCASAKKIHGNFNEENSIFNVYFTHLSDEKQISNKRLLVENTFIKLKKVKPEFEHQFLLDFAFIILCYQPLQLAIFLRHLRFSKWRCLRNFLSYMAQEDIFDELLTLEACRRAFYLLLRSYKEKYDIYRLVTQYSEKSLVEEFTVKTFADMNDFHKALQKNVIAFQNKKDKLTGFNRSFRLKKYSLQDREASIRESLKDPAGYKEKTVNQYVFSDSDDDYQEEEADKIQFKSQDKRKQRQIIQFDPKNQRKHFIRKDRTDSIEVRKTSLSFQSHQVNSPQKILSRDGIKKFLSLNINLQAKSNQNDLPSPIKTLKPQRQQSTSSKEPSSSRTLKHKHTFEQQIKKKSSKQFKKIDLHLHVEADEDSDDEPIFHSNRISEQVQQNKSSYQQELEENASIILKKIYRTYDDNHDRDPYSLKVLETEKSKTSQGFTQLVKLVVKKIYERPQMNMQTAFKLIGQIGRNFPEAQINLQNAEIFQKIAKFEAKYGLQLPIQKILSYEGLHLKSKTPQQLFALIKEGIIQVCDDQNIFKISKLISIGFKKNTIEQEIIVLYLGKLISQLNMTVDYAELEAGLEKIKGLISKMQVRTLVERTESVVDQCTHFDLRRKLVDIFISTIRMKGNGKDAKQLANKLK